MKLTIRQLKRVIKESFPSWDELPEKDQLASTYSDVYKEKYGIRPRFMRFDEMSVEELKAELERLYDERGYDDVDYLPVEQEFPEPDSTVTDDELTNVHSMESLPTTLGMGRDEDTVGYEKRRGEFAGDVGRKNMKITKGR